MYQITLKPRRQSEHWRSLADYWKISERAKKRLEWMIFYYSVGRENSTTTASYFGISRKTFWKWKRRFDPKVIQSLEERSRAPKRRRVWSVTPLELERVTVLREASNCKWGKEKIKHEYFRIYKGSISANKIQKIISRCKLYPDLTERKCYVRRLKKRNLKPKVRIHEFTKEYPKTVIWHTDTVIMYWYGERRTILTAIEDKTKLAFARVYENATSRAASDFLKRLVFLTGENIKVIHSDNGGEFRGEFEKACLLLNIEHIYSRLRTPKDNPFLERFNWTIQDEWLSVSEVGLDEILQANFDLTQWLIKYNFERPHQSLDYKTPIQYAMENYPQVLPMTPARTVYGIFLQMRRNYLQSS